jgi:sulfopyruvate decarboxylase subunit beta
LQRIDALRGIYSELAGSAVVTAMGGVAGDLQTLGHRPGFFYMQHSMGLASSMGLGIALARPDLQVVVLDGDGSLAMNLGSLTTIGHYQPDNLIYVVFDNGSYACIGGTATTTSGTADLEIIARGAGIRRATTANDPDEFAEAFRSARESRHLAAIVAKVEPNRGPGYPANLGLIENRFEMARALQG